MSDTGLAFHQFTGDAGGSSVTYLVLKMKDSLYLWMGKDGEAPLENLSVAITLPQSANTLSSQILGPPLNTVSSAIAAHLSKRLRKQVFVSYNFPGDDKLLMTAIEERLAEEIKVSPNYF